MNRMEGVLLHSSAAPVEVNTADMFLFISVGLRGSGMRLVHGAAAAQGTAHLPKLPRNGVVSARLSVGRSIQNDCIHQMLTARQSAAKTVLTVRSGIWQGNTLAECCKDALFLLVNP